MTSPAEPTDPREAVGADHDRSAMLEARRRTREAVRRIAVAVEPGMVEEDAVDLARRLLAEAELLRGWHGTYVRFGPNTVKPYGATSEPGRVLGADDIFIVDIGPVWRKWEGDAGDTFTTGADPEMNAARRDVRTLWDRTHAAWRQGGISGEALYRFAGAEAHRMGWVLNLDLSGHRLSDFPHSAVHKGHLADFERSPRPELWVLEIHIRHPTRPFGAFYEDTLLEAPDAV